MNDMGVTQGAGTRNGGADQRAVGKDHSLVALNRGEITVKGVREVLSFDDQNVRLVTTCGILNLEGDGLRVHVLNTGEGVVAVTGTLNGVLYEDETADGGTGRYADGSDRKKGRLGGRKRFFG